MASDYVFESGEVTGWRMVQLAAFPGRLDALERAVTPLLGALPYDARTALTTRDQLLFRTAPEQYWVVSREDLAPALQSTVPASVGAITRLSHSRTRLFIEGPQVRNVLAKGIAVDLHPDAFPVDAFAQTSLHHTPVLLHRTAAERYEIYVLRSYRAWLREWLADAASHGGIGAAP